MYIFANQVRKCTARVKKEAGYEEERHMRKRHAGERERTGSIVHETERKEGRGKTGCGGKSERESDRNA